MAFNSGQRLFEAQRLLQEVWEALIKQKIVEGSYSNALNYHEKNIGKHGAILSQNNNRLRLTEGY